MVPHIGTQVVDTATVEGGGPAHDAVDLVAFFDKQFRQIRTVLAGNAGDKGLLGHLAKTTSIVSSHNTNYYTFCVEFLTSWDDGYVLDLRVADLLDTYGANGTFYVCPRVQHGQTMLTDEEIKELSASHTVGAHTMTHPHLPRVSLEQAQAEIEESKRWIEEVAGKPCTTFCYPYGAVTPRIKEMVKTAGFKEARTTRDLEFSAEDSFLKPVTLQIFPFPFRRRIQMSWKMFDFFGPLRARYPRLRKLNTPHVSMRSWLALAKYLYDYARETQQPFFHLYGHSREIEKYGMWGDLEEFLKYVKAKQ